MHPLADKILLRLASLALLPLGCILQFSKKHELLILRHSLVLERDALCLEPSDALQRRSNLLPMRLEASLRIFALTFTFTEVALLVESQFLFEHEGCHLYALKTVKLGIGLVLSFIIGR